MKTSKWLMVLGINALTAVLVISPFLPGPSNKIVDLFYDVGQLLGIIGLVIAPIGIIWTARELKQRKINERHVIDVRAILLTTVPLILFLASMYLSDFCRGLSRSIAIDRAEPLIQAIESYKSRKGSLPPTLADLSPEYIGAIPSTGVMGIDEYRYDNKGVTYIISFQQNVVLGFNFEVVIFDPTDRHQSEGELPMLYETGKAHWRYYVYD